MATLSFLRRRTPPQYGPSRGPRTYAGVPRTLAGQVPGLHSAVLASMMSAMHVFGVGPVISSPLPKLDLRRPCHVINVAPQPPLL
jgi:hypothetical protein